MSIAGSGTSVDLSLAVRKRTQRLGVKGAPRGVDHESERDVKRLRSHLERNDTLVALK